MSLGVYQKLYVQNFKKKCMFMLMDHMDVLPDGIQSWDPHIHMCPINTWAGDGGVQLAQLSFTQESTESTLRCFVVNHC